MFVVGQACVRQPQLVKSLMELGYMHNCVQSLSQELEKGGAVARGLTCAIRTQLTDYYRKIAQLNSDVSTMHKVSSVLEKRNYIVIYGQKSGTIWKFCFQTRKL